MSTTLRECGTLRVTETDALLDDFKINPRNAKAFTGNVIWKGEDLKKRFSHDGRRINLGTKSCLAQLGIFGSIMKKGKTYHPDVEITDDRIVAKVMINQYSDYPMDLWEGMEFGRFYNVLGNHLTRKDLLEVLSEYRDMGKPVYEPGEDLEVEELVDEEGGLTLSTLPRAFRVDPTLEVKQRFRVSSRKDLTELFREEQLTDHYEMKQGEFLVTDTPRIRMPKGYSGLLKVDQHGDMTRPAHLNSPIVDSPFGNGDREKEPYTGHLRLELYHAHPNPVPLQEVFVRLYFYREDIVKVLAPDADGQEKMFPL